MDLRKQRKLKFKAWNEETRLMMRLNSIECVKGELHKKHHVLLQFTGYYDINDEEVYERDVLLFNNHKYIVVWHDEDAGGWYYHALEQSDAQTSLPFSRIQARRMSRLCNYFETSQ